MDPHAQGCYASRPALGASHLFFAWICRGDDCSCALAAVRLVSSFGGRDGAVRV